MKLAIMQPYFFPYIGYFQLINAVDKFVIYDDVNYINRGWINRNNFLVNGHANLFTLPLLEASQNKKINEIELLQDDKWKNKFIRTIEQNYKKAPYFEFVYPVIKNSLLINENNIARFNILQLKAVCDYLNINTEIIPTSGSYNNNHLKGQYRILDICMKEQAKVYINPEGGVELYETKNFNEQGIELFFIKSHSVIYKQFKNEFIPWLSIIDIMMFNTKETILNFLDQYTLISNE